MKLTTKFAAVLVVCVIIGSAGAQETTSTSADEKRVPLNEVALAHDANGAAALEATLLTTGLNGSPESPVKNVRLIVRNTSGISYAFVSGVVTFYDSANIRCGEGIFKADVLAGDEAFETDTPGLRIFCEAVTWRIVATHLLPRVPPNPPAIPADPPRP